MSFGRRPNPVFSGEYQHLREILITARREAGVSQRELAARIGKCCSHVSRIEQGQRRVDVLEFYRIAASLGAEPGELFRAATAGLAAGRRIKPGE
jgi:transcriptional regulator with XRE-family HTH domain